MLLLFVLVWLCQLCCSELKGKAEVSLTQLKNKWYGPSYQPQWRSPTNSATVFFRRGEFSYDDQKEWSEAFKDCGGRYQSPINVETSRLKRKKTRKPLKWSNYSKIPEKMVVQNSLHSIHANGVWKNSTYIPYITKGPLEKRYYFSQLHFHWGKTDSVGSEHTINSKSYPLEMHVVHDRRVDDPTNLSEESNSDSLVVVSYMFEIVKSDNPALNPLLEAISDIEGNEKKKTYIRPFPLEDLVEPFSGDYVTYKGSLTTPPCTEGVIWIINSKALGISDRQIRTLRKSVRNERGYPIRNYRAVQNLNRRTVYYVYC